MFQLGIPDLKQSKELLNKIKLKSQSNFFSKLKIGQPETLSMQNNINLFFDQAVKPEIFKISSVKTKDKNEMSAILKKTQKEMSF